MSQRFLIPREKLPRSGVHVDAIFGDKHLHLETRDACKCALDSARVFVTAGRMQGCDFSTLEEIRARDLRAEQRRRLRGLIFY